MTRHHPIPALAAAALLAGTALALSGCSDSPVQPSGSALRRNVIAAAPTTSPLQVIDLGTLGGTNSEARGINARGQVVGASSTTQETIHAALWQ